MAQFLDTMKKRNHAGIAKAPKYRVWGTDEVVYGPIELLTLVDWIRQERVTPDCWVHCDRNRAWLQAGTFDELKPLFRSRPRTRAIQEISAARAGVTPETLDRVKLLAGLTDQQLESFLHYMEVVTLEPPQRAIKEGDHGQEMFLILEGELRVQLSRNGRDTILATLTAGEFFGEIALLDQGPRSADVLANERSTLLKISAKSFAKLRKEAPALAEPFLFALGKSVVGRVRGLNKRYQESLMVLQALTVT